MISTLTLHRLAKEQAQLEKQPIPNALIQRQSTLNFYFCLYNLEGSYAGGFYFGLLELHQKYPFNAPKLIFYTPSGRFDTNLPICTSFTNYHQQSWTSAWNVRTLILATISFMYSEQPSYGCCHMSHEQRAQMAKQSLKFNMQNQLFVRLFSQKLKTMGLLSSQMFKHVSCKNQSISRREQLDNNFKVVQNNEEAKQIVQIKQQVQEHPLNKQQQKFPRADQDQSTRYRWITKVAVYATATLVVWAMAEYFKVGKYLKGK